MKNATATIEQAPGHIRGSAKIVQTGQGDDHVADADKKVQIGCAEWCDYRDDPGICDGESCVADQTLTSTVGLPRADEHGDLRRPELGLYPARQHIAEYRPQGMPAGDLHTVVLRLALEGWSEDQHIELTLAQAEHVREMLRIALEQARQDEAVLFESGAAR